MWVPWDAATIENERKCDPDLILTTGGECVTVKQLFESPQHGQIVCPACLLSCSGFHLNNGGSDFVKGQKTQGDFFLGILAAFHSTYNNALHVSRRNVEHFKGQSAVMSPQGGLGCRLATPLTHRAANVHNHTCHNMGQCIQKHKYTSEQICRFPFFWKSKSRITENWRTGAWQDWN